MRRAAVPRASPDNVRAAGPTHSVPRAASRAAGRHWRRCAAARLARRAAPRGVSCVAPTVQTVKLTLLRRPTRAALPWRPLRLRRPAASACGTTTGCATRAARASTCCARRADTATTSGAAASTRALTPAAAAARPATSAASPATPATTAVPASTHAAAAPHLPRRTACRKPPRPWRKSSRTRCTPAREGRLRRRRRAARLCGARHAPSVLNVYPRRQAAANAGGCRYGPPASRCEP